MYSLVVTQSPGEEPLGRKPGTSPFGQMGRAGGAGVLVWALRSVACLYLWKEKPNLMKTQDGAFPVGFSLMQPGEQWKTRLKAPEEHGRLLPPDKICLVVIASFENQQWKITKVLKQIDVWIKTTKNKWMSEQKQ